MSLDKDQQQRCEKIIVDALDVIHDAQEMLDDSEHREELDEQDEKTLPRSARRG